MATTDIWTLEPADPLRAQYEALLDCAVDLRREMKEIYNVSCFDPADAPPEMTRRFPKFIQDEASKALEASALIDQTDYQLLATGIAREGDLSRRPIIVCLCGSTRFRAEYEEAFRREEHAGRICLTVPCYKDDSCCKRPEDWAVLDALHRRKIDIADEVLFLNVGGYVGESTRAEIAYARSRCKTIRFLEPEPA